MKIFIGLSGGVDSSVAAALLQKEGHDVHGVYLKVWSPDLEDLMHGCPWEEDVQYASATAKYLGISFAVWDVSKEYYDKVVSYFFSEYREGRTPNPDIMCNREMKFGIFLERARKEGADMIATGHYVRSVARHSGASSLASFSRLYYRGSLQPRSSIPDRQISGKIVARHAAREDSAGLPFVQLLQAKDLNKDQSYFLYSLSQEQLRYALFPIGDYTKPEVRKMAKEWGLPTADRKDSQGLCFLGKISVRDFLKTRIEPHEGVLITTSGKVVGRHEGAQYFTIGQRHGIGSKGGGTPYFVVEKNIEQNTVVVAEGKNDAALYQSGIVLENMHWIAGKSPTLPLTCMARIRYRQPLQECTITADGSVHFIKPQRAVTPGQACVFYTEETMLGGGVIR